MTDIQFRVDGQWVPGSLYSDLMWGWTNHEAAAARVDAVRFMEPAGVIRRTCYRTGGATLFGGERIVLPLAVAHELEAKGVNTQPPVTVKGRDLAF